jgi:NitT/TauT family transport system permease protein
MARLLTVLLKLIPGVLVLLLWQLFVWLNPQNEFFIGSPRGVVKELIPLFLDGSLLRDVWATMLEAILGFVLGSAFGTAAGLFLWFSVRLRTVVRPYIGVLGAIPIFALGPIVIFWFGTEMMSKVVLGFLSTFAIAVSQAYAGAVEADPNLHKLMKAYGASRSQIFMKLIVPSSTIWVLAGLRLNIGMALLGAFVGEFIASKQGLGHLIIVAEGLYNINQVWVGVFGIVSLATLFLAATTPVEGWARRWKTES